MLRTLLVAALALTACGEPASKNAAPNNTSNATTNNPTNNTLGCEDTMATYVSARNALPRDCTAAADCQLIDRTQYGGCTGAVRGYADLAAFEAAAAANLNVCGTLEPNNFTCEFAETGDMQASCVDAICTAVPQAACNSLSDVVADARTGCAEAGECEVRSGKCGCPLAVLTASDQSAIDELLRICDYSETCALIDCADGSEATCNAGTCELL